MALRVDSNRSHFIHAAQQQVCRIPLPWCLWTVVVSMPSHPSQGIRFLQRDQVDEGLRMLRGKGVDAEVSPYLPSHFLRVHTGLQSVLCSSYRKGIAIQVICVPDFGRTGRITDAFVCQDEAAGLVVALMLAPKPHERILDCCAAPGGKLFFIAQLMHNSVKTPLRAESSFTSYDAGGACRY